MSEEGPTGAEPLGIDEAASQELAIPRGERVRASVEYALVFVLLGVSLAVVVTVFLGARLGGLVISLTLVAAALARTIAVEPSPRGLVVRSRMVDVSTLLALAMILAFLGQTAQSL